MGMFTAIRTLPRGELLRLFAAGILLAGLCCAALVYATATDADGPETDTAQGAGYVSEGGQSFAVLPQDSRSYRRSLEYHGGKSALMMLELRQWFAGLWHGTSLALVIACVAVLAAGACLYFAGPDGIDEADGPGADDGPGAAVGSGEAGGPDGPGRQGTPGEEPGGRGSRTQP